ncbi:MAG TPA: histidine phosphatase family protein [Planctomycetes bacterium]|nr:histidine phosphatase family protein [Planctomycetota bacterium]
MLNDPKEHSRLVLIRHPLLAEPFARQALGQGSAELARRGRSQWLQVMKTLDAIPIDRVFAAPVAHSSEPARALAGDRDLELEEDPRLLDQDLGDWSGKLWEEIRREDPDKIKEFFLSYGTAAAPGGESLNESLDRIRSWWEDLRGEVFEKTVAVVAGGHLLQGFAAWLIGLSLGRAPALALPPGAFGILDVYTDGAVCRCWHPLCLSEEMP